MIRILWQLNVLPVPYSKQLKMKQFDMRLKLAYKQCYDYIRGGYLYWPCVQLSDILHIKRKPMMKVICQCARLVVSYTSVGSNLIASSLSFET